MAPRTKHYPAHHFKHRLGNMVQASQAVLDILAQWMAGGQDPSCAAAAPSSMLVTIPMSLQTTEDANLSFQSIVMCFEHTNIGLVQCTTHHEDGCTLAAVEGAQKNMGLASFRKEGLIEDVMWLQLGYKEDTKEAFFHLQRHVCM